MSRDLVQFMPTLMDTSQRLEHLTLSLDGDYCYIEGEDTAGAGYVGLKVPFCELTSHADSFVTDLIAGKLNLTVFRNLRSIDFVPTYSDTWTSVACTLSRLPSRPLHGELRKIKLSFQVPRVIPRADLSSICAVLSFSTCASNHDCLLTSLNGSS
jgi:hypothetical protein